MPVQKLEPMSKDFPTFDCDAHITEPPSIWELAKERLTKEELADLKATIWYEPEAERLIVNNTTAYSGTVIRNRKGEAGSFRVNTIAGPGIKHNVQRALHVRNLRPETALTEEESAYLDHLGSYEPKARLRDMDVQGIDQVMVIPTNIDCYPWLQNTLGARAWCKAYNDWAYEYTLEDPDRLYFAAILPVQDPRFAVEELYRVAKMGCRVGLIRPVDAMGNYPVQPKYEPLWDAMEDTGLIYGMHPFPAGLFGKPAGYSEMYSGAELIERILSTSDLPHSFLDNIQAFMAEASLWVTMVLMSGLFERHPKLKAAVFESDSTWISFVLDECDKAYRLHRNDRLMAPLKHLPSETFFEHCFTGFEGDEVFPSRLPDYYEDITVWASDIYHHDGDDAWKAIETMREVEATVEVQVKMLGGNARRMYNIKPPKNIIRERVTEIERPDWWPTDEEIERALKPESSIVR